MKSKKFIAQIQNFELKKKINFQLPLIILNLRVCI